jgi:hypothetical protein
MSWDEFRIALDKSLIAIEPHYFHIKRYHSKLAWRERAYCYELYHQLRCHLRKDFPYTLHGEIDKSGAGYVCEQFKFNKLGCPNPDFVVHIPGKPKNLAVVEVKSSTSSKKGAQKDVNKLKIFIKNIEYQHGIFLFFGSEGDVQELVNGLAIDDGLIPESKLCVLWHKNCGESPEVLKGSF